jgi:hypothetical protein
MPEPHGEVNYWTSKPSVHSSDMEPARRLSPLAALTLVPQDRLALGFDLFELGCVGNMRITPIPSTAQYIRVFSRGRS